MSIGLQEYWGVGVLGCRSNRVFYIYLAEKTPQYSYIPILLKFRSNGFQEYWVKKKKILLKTFSRFFFTKFTSNGIQEYWDLGVLGKNKYPILLKLVFKDFVIKFRSNGIQEQWVKKITEYSKNQFSRFFSSLNLGVLGKKNTQYS